MKRTWKIKLTLAQLLELAQRLDMTYAHNIALGLRLTSASGLWKTKSRGITARFVYRGGKPQSETTITTIIRGIRP